MNRWKLIVVTMGLGLVTGISTVPAQETGAKRTILTKQDLTGFPGHEGVVARVELAAGGKEPKHTHPGDIFVCVQEGTLTVTLEGKPPAVVKPGEVFFVPAGMVHWGEAGATAVKALVTYVVEKGKPLTSPVQ
jgi:quercetin dioxygenase-like cupin family protein